MFHPSHIPTKNAGRRVMCRGGRALTAPTPTAAIKKNGGHSFPAAPVRASTAQTSSAFEEFFGANATAGTPAAPLDNSATCDTMKPPCAGSSVIFEKPSHLSSDAMPSDGAVKNATLGSSSLGVDALRTSMSRRGLSVHAAPFKPRHVTDATALKTPDGLEFVDLFSIQDEQQRLATGSSGVLSRHATYHQLTPQRTVWSAGVEFPFTPRAAEALHARLTSPTDVVGCVATVLATSSADVCGGDSLSYSAPLPSVFVNSAKQWPSFSSSLNYGGGSNDHDLRSPNDNGCSVHDNIRHRRVAFTDAEAMNEDVMLDMLRCSSSSEGVDNCNDDDEEDAVYMDHYQQQYVFDVTPAHPTDLDVYSCAGGYWDIRGPRAATRRLLHRGGNSSTASLTLTALSGRASPSFVSGGGVVADRGGGNDFYDGADDDFWEINSSAYTDSLDEVQVEWIEQQLHAKENPDGFFP